MVTNSSGPYTPLTYTGIREGFGALIKNYQKTIYARAAYESFLENYNSEHQREIENATSNNAKIAGIGYPDGITTAAEAQAVLEASHYIQHMTTFRIIGLLTGIDVESLDDPDFTLTTADWGFFDAVQSVEDPDDILYNTGVGRRTQPGNNVGYGFIESPGEPLSRTRSATSQFFSDTSMLQHLSAKAFYIAERANQAGVVGDSNPFKDLGKKLAENIRDLIAQYEANSDITNDDPAGPGATFTLDEWIENSKIRMSEIASTIDQAGDGTPEQRAATPGYGTWRLPLETFMPAHMVQTVVLMGAVVDTPIYYADIATARPKQLTTQWIKSLITSIGDYTVLLDQIIAVDYERHMLYPRDENKMRADALANILHFFGTAEATDPLPDQPAGGPTLEEVITDPELGPVVQEAWDSARRNLTPFDMQCYLMENIHQIVAKRTAAQRGTAFAREYKHSRVLTTNSISPAMITNTLQHGGPDSDKSKRIKQILNLCPEVYAALVPYIKIYRVDYDEDGSIAIDPSTKKAVEKELVIPNFIDPTDLNNILRSSRGRIPGAGIKSFSWSLVGVQPEEVDNNITAKLVIYFQSINDFFRGASQAGNKEPNFLDLLINSPAVRKLQEAHSEPDEETTVCGELQKNLHRRYEGKNYRIKVVAGWSAPSNLLDLMPHSDPANIEKLIEAIDETKVSLFLQQVRHSLDFKDDGALEMSIDYQASLAGLLTSPRADIFGEDPILIRDQIDAIDVEIERIDDLEQSTRDLPANKKEVKALLEKKKELNRRGKMYKYKKLLQGLFDPLNSKIHAIEISGAELMMPPYRDLDPEQRAARAKRKMTTAVEFTDTFELYAEMLNAVSTAQENSEVDAVDQYIECTDDRYSSIRPNSNITTVSFWFLGDIIDNVLAQMKKNNNGTALSFDVFLSDVEMVDPLLALQLKNLDDVLNCGDIREIEFLATLFGSSPGTFANFDLVNIMNIGDIPISTDAFQLFFKNRVVKKDRETYHFLYFIKELCAELITKALNKTCFGPDISFQQRFDARPLTYISDSETKRPFTSLRHLAKQSDILPSTPIGDTRQALIILPIDSRPRNLVGDYVKDTAKGIYHQYIGASCGLLKTLKFNREDQEYLRESKIQRQGALGAEQLRELYSSTLELVGNNLYKNGMYIYINPTLMDADEVQLDYLGLHGYYLVTGVQSSVTPQGFTTSLTALHEGIEFNAPGMNAEWWSVAPERAPQEAPDLPLPEPEAHVPTTRGNWESRNDRSEAEPEPAPVRIRTRGIPEIGSELEAGNTAANTPEWEIPTPDCEPTDFECWSALEEAIAIPVDGG